MEQQKKYFPGLDYLKVILAMLVVMRHACQYFLPTESIFYILNVNILSACAVPCFFVISGYLFFSRENASLRKQCIRLLRLYLVWTVIYLPLNIFLMLKGKLTIIQFIQEFLFSGSHYHLWFLPSLIVALLINWIVRNKNVLIVGICFSVLFVIALLSEPYNFLVSENINKLYKLYSSVFITCRNGLFFGTIYIFIGRMLAKFEWAEKPLTKILLCCFIGAIFLLLEGILLNLYKHYSVINILATCIIFCPMLFLLFININKINNISAVCCRTVSTVVFCSHPIILGITSKVFKTIHINSRRGATVMSLFFTLFLSYLVIYFSEKKCFKFLKMLY